MFVPELDLVIVHFGANYNDGSAFIPIQQLIPRVILPAVQPGK